MSCKWCVAKRWVWLPCKDEEMEKQSRAIELLDEESGSQGIMRIHKTFCKLNWRWITVGLSFRLKAWALLFICTLQFKCIYAIVQHLHTQVWPHCHSNFHQFWAELQEGFPLAFQICNVRSAPQRYWSQERQTSLGRWLLQGRSPLLLSSPNERNMPAEYYCNYTDGVKLYYI